MNQQRILQQWRHGFMLVLLIWGGLCPVLAQVMPDALLFEQGRDAIQQGQVEKGIALLEGLRTQYPESGVLQDVDMLLFDHYLAAGQSDRAVRLWEEACRRWPRTEIILKMINSYFPNLVDIDPASAFSWLDTVKSKGILPPGGELQVCRLRLDYLQRTHSNQYFTEAMAVVESAHAAPTVDNVRFAVDIANQLYLPLMQDKRFTEARYLFQTILTMAQRLDNASSVKNTVAKQYLASLEKCDPQQFCTEALEVFSQINTITSAKETAGYSSLAQQIYPPLLRQGHFPDAQKVHLLLREALIRFCTPDEVRKEQQDWLTALYTAHDNQFIPEAKAYLAQLDERTAIIEKSSVLRVSKLIYGVLYEADRLDDAKALHAQLHGIFIAFSGKSFALSEYGIFTTVHLEYYQQKKPSEYSAEVNSIFTALLQAVSTSDDLRPFLQQIESTYKPLSAAGHFDVAQALHDNLQATIVRIGKPFTWLLDDQTQFMEIWWATNPKTFEALYVPKLLAAGSITSHDDLDIQLAAVRYLYPKLLADGRVDDVKIAHEHLQTACANLGERTDKANEEYRFYLDSLISGAPQCFISELPSFITRITPTPEATNGSIIRSARLAGPIYGFLIQGGGVEYAKVLHTRVQAALTAKQLTDIAAIDEKQYQQSFSIKSLEGIYQLFTKAVARDDIADAKRLMNQLTDIAPEDPRAIHARTTYRTILSKGDKK